MDETKNKGGRPRTFRNQALPEKNPAAVALGSIKSERKAASSRANGAKNKENAGRPCKPVYEFECTCPYDHYTWDPAANRTGWIRKHIPRRSSCPRGRAERRREKC